MNTKTREQLAKLEHDQWMSWSKSIQRYVPPARRKRWKKLWKPYNQLTEAEKDQDREWADKAVKIVEKSSAYQLGRALANDWARVVNSADKRL